MVDSNQVLGAGSHINDNESFKAVFTLSKLFRNSADMSDQLWM